MEKNIMKYRDQEGNSVKVCYHFPSLGDVGISEKEFIIIYENGKGYNGHIIPKSITNGGRGLILKSLEECVEERVTAHELDSKINYILTDFPEFLKSVLEEGISDDGMFLPCFDGEY